MTQPLSLLVHNGGLKRGQQYYSTGSFGGAGGWGNYGLATGTPAEGRVKCCCCNCYGCSSFPASTQINCTWTFGGYVRTFPLTLYTDTQGGVTRVWRYGGDAYYAEGEPGFNCGFFLFCGVGGSWFGGHTFSAYAETFIAADPPKNKPFEFLKYWGNFVEGWRCPVRPSTEQPGKCDPRGVPIVIDGYYTNLEGQEVYPERCEMDYQEWGFRNSTDGGGATILLS